MLLFTMQFLESHFCTVFIICISIDRSSRLRPQRMCEQEHVGLSNAFLHNSAARAKHTACMSDLSVGLSLRCDWSIRNGAELNGSVYCIAQEKNPEC